MSPMKNYIKSTNIMYTGSNKIFPEQCVILRVKILKRTLKYLYSTKSNEIHMCD